MKMLKLFFGLPVLVSCVSLPDAPSVMVLPGTGKNFTSFRNDDMNCRQYAYQQIGGETPNQAAIASGAGSALIGSGLGAAAGAALGGGGGAAIGAGTGLIAGSVVGSSNANYSGYAAQEAYDNAYIQCMYGQGHRVPVPGQFANDVQNNSQTVRPPDPNLPPPPPPPPGAPPPPPPGY
jgi:hypothetical protein